MVPKRYSALEAAHLGHPDASQDASIAPSGQSWRHRILPAAKKHNLTKYDKSEDAGRGGAP
jgi:hypothetical protein